MLLFNNTATCHKFINLTSDAEIWTIRLENFRRWEIGTIGQKPWWSTRVVISFDLLTPSSSPLGSRS